MLDLHEMALDPGSADLGFVSKDPVFKWLFCSETLAIGSLSL